MRYSYECPACGAQQDWIGSWQDKPETLTCECGHEAQQLLCFNLAMKVTAPAMPSAKEIVRRLYEQKGREIQANAAAIRAKDRSIVENARNRISAERSRPKVHGSTSGVEQAVVPMRWQREYEMRNGQGSWNTLMKDKKALKRTLKDAGLWSGGS